MKPLVTILGIASLLVGLAGCFGPLQRSDPPKMALTAHVIRDTTQAILEVTGVQAQEYRWNFGYGDPPATITTKESVIVHTFPKIGRYGVTVVAVGVAGAGSPGEDQGPGLGPIVPEPGSGGTLGAWAIVDFTKDNPPYPVILLLNCNNQPASFFYPFSSVTFSATSSFSRLSPLAECSFRWRIVRIDPETEEEIGYLFGENGVLLPSDPIISREIIFTVPNMPGPTDCRAQPTRWWFKAELDMWDEFNNHARAKQRFQVGYP